MFTQEMPPPGGYAPINIARAKSTKIISNWIVAIACVATAIHFKFRYDKSRRRMATINLEKYDAFIALEPFLHAERDRDYLNSLRIYREEEKDIMKNVKGWVIGTLYGERKYKSLPPGRDGNPTPFEIFGHRPVLEKELTIAPERYYE